MIKEYWESFMKKTVGSEEFGGSVFFGMNETDSALAVEQIIKGEKTAMIYPACGYRASMNGESAVGKCFVVTNWNGEPACIAETIAAKKLLLGEMSADYAKAEGFDSLDAWKEKRVPELKIEIEELGYEMTDETELIIESFTVLDAHRV